jgi:hypothetical protein
MRSLLLIRESMTENYNYSLCQEFLTYYIYIYVIHYIRNIVNSDLISNVPKQDGGRSE